MGIGDRDNHENIRVTWMKKEERRIQ